MNIMYNTDNLCTYSHDNSMRIHAQENSDTDFQYQTMNIQHVDIQ